MDPSIRLSDEEVRRFICDGALVLESGVADEVNAAIFEKIAWNNTREFNMGNNVLPRIPELQQVLDAPRIHGALETVLGEDYVLHPHRFMHASEPLEADQRAMELAGDEHGPAMGKGSSASSHWHQDSQSPLSRGRYHVPRLAMLIYFPQDTPPERGPTRVIPGTHLQARLSEEDYPYSLVPEVKAGTCLLVAFDIGHAGLSNRTDLSRYMFKFVFMRRRHPTGPTWAGEVGPWQDPRERLGRHAVPGAWSYVWDWMRGAKPGRSYGEGGSIESRLAALNGADEAARLNAIYSFSGGEAAEVRALAASLEACAGRDREFPLRFKKDAQGRFVPDGDMTERRWDEGAYAVQDEAYALGAIGAPALLAIAGLLEHPDAWVKINAAFAAGEVGPEAASLVPKLAELLEHERHQVARAALDAMTAIGTNIAAALPALTRLLTESNPRWQRAQRRGWSGEDQARFNALCVLLSSDVPYAELEPLLVRCLDDRNGYVPALALEMLTETKDSQPTGLAAALTYLKTHRWDDTLAAGQRVF